MNLVLELAEIEKQVNALISENINLKKENKELTEQNTSFLISVENLNKSVQELEAEVKEWKDKADLWCRTANLKDHNIMINKELEKHNEELIALINAERKRQEQCDDIHLRKIAELEKENAELQEYLGEVQMQKAGEKSDLVWHLKEANEQKVEQLTKAKEIIKDYMIVATSGHITVCSVPEEKRCINVLKLNEQSEQFLKENE